MITSSIVVYVINFDQEQKQELKSVIESASSSIIDIIYIIDNSPTNVVKDFVCSLSAKIMYIFNNGNLGYGAAHNIALKQSMCLGADYHIVLNPDINFTEVVIASLKNYMDFNVDVGAVMPQVKYPDGEIQYLCKLQPTPFDLIARRFIPYKKYVEKCNDKYELRSSGYNKIMNVPCLSGCFMFIRVSTLKTIGLFDDDYFMYCEDFDFYKRMHKHYKTIFFPEVSIIHNHRKESYKSKKMMRIHMKSAIHYFNKWGWFFDKDRKKANNEILNEIGLGKG